MTAPRRPATFPSFLRFSRTAPMTADRRQARRRPARSRTDRGGFTLIEMLIAVTLVLLMMTLFAQVFGLATETMSMRKGMAANDQKGRLLASRIGQDLDARTVDVVYPFSGAQLAYRPTRLDPSDPTSPITGWGPKFAEFNGNTVYTTPSLTDGTEVWQAVIPEVPEDDRRRGFFSISENDPDDDGDDVISFTTDRTKRAKRADADFSPARGRAAVLPAGDGSAPLAPGQPALDPLTPSGADGEERFAGGALSDASHPSAAYGAAYGNVAAAASAVIGNVDPVGESAYEVVAYFLRDGNLVRKRQLVREPSSDVAITFGGVTKTAHEWMFDDGDADTNPDDWPPAGDSFHRFFDYAAFRRPDVAGPRFHSAQNGLVNKTGGAYFGHDYNGDFLDELRLPVSLGNPYLRDGAGFFGFDVTAASNVRPLGRPREFSTKVAGPSAFFSNAGAARGLSDAEWTLPGASAPAPFLGRYLPQEQSVAAYNLPGREAPNVAGNPLFRPSLVDGNVNSVVPWYASPGARRPADPRRGEEILVANAHSLDVEVFDDAIGDFVDLGHTRTVPAPDLYDVPGGTSGNVTETLQVAGDYHADRLIARNPGGGPAIDLNGDGVPDLDFNGDGNPDPHPFGNRFDTWHPEMNLMGVGYVTDGAGGSFQVAVERPYPPPYRPTRNPLGGDVGVPTRDHDGNLFSPDLSFSGTGLRFLPNARDADLAQSGGRAPITTEAIYRDRGDNDRDVFLDPTTPRFESPGSEGTDDDGLTFGLAPGATRTLSTAGTNEKDFAEGIRTPVPPAGPPLPVLFPDPNEFGAYGSDDEKPLRAVRITVRYYDVQSDRMRQESFRHSLLD